MEKITNTEEYRKFVQSLSKDELIKLDLYLRKIALGEIKEESTGFPTLDKPWLKYYSEDIIKSEIPKMNIYEYI